jgi:hypothetical protein
VGLNLLCQGKKYFVCLHDLIDAILLVYSRFVGMTLDPITLRPEALKVCIFPRFSIRRDWNAGPFPDQASNHGQRASFLAHHHVNRPPLRNEGVHLLHCSHIEVDKWPVLIDLSIRGAVSHELDEKIAKRDRYDETQDD